MNWFGIYQSATFIKSKHFDLYSYNNLQLTLIKDDFQENYSFVENLTKRKGHRAIGDLFIFNHSSLLVRIPRLPLSECRGVPVPFSFSRRVACRPKFS